ncbi:MAG: FAD-binding protein [Paracoccaceae bacterium]|nr:FAD-binding protein [Paracoccaceae bacterium]
MLDTLAPDSEAAISEAIRAADGPLRIEGGGTRPIGGLRDGQALSVAGHAGVSLYEPGALTLVARAGTPVAEIEAVLAAEGQALPFEPVDHRGLFGTAGRPTIGGAVATNASGPRRIAVGAVRDFLLGVRFVDGTGTIVKNGGRVMKNVTGYDLVKLLCGSHGTLGVLTEVAFKVLPAPAAQATIALEGLDPTGAVAAMAAAMASPFEVSGAAHDCAAGRTLLRLEGFEAQVVYRGERLEEVLAPFGSAVVDPDAGRGAETWAGIRDMARAHGTDEDIWRISVKPSDGPSVVAALAGARCVMDWAGGLVTAAVPPGTDVRTRLGGIPGHATLLRGGEESRARFAAFEPEPEPVARLTAGLRARFDPRGVLNPGLMG